MKKILIWALFLFVLGGVGYSLYQRNDNVSNNEEVGYVYETEVDGPSDCSSLEKYDEERKICYFECSDEVQCKEIEDKVDQELASWTEELAKDKEPVGEKTISTNDSSKVGDYSVTQGEVITFESGEDREEFREIWKSIKELSPNEISDKYIETYEVFDNASDDTLAFVDDEDGNKKWRIAVNLAGYNSSSLREKKSTIIHELGHIITLNSSQVDPTNTDKESCANFFVDEGCSMSGSYLNGFYNTFRKNDPSNEFDENKFVTEYAATNEVEDMAESFAFFVLSNGKLDEGLVKNQKVNYFYNYPELAKVRSQMRSVLTRDILGSN